MRVRSFSILLLAMLAAAPAQAAFHLMKIVEVHSGSSSDPNSQAVVLQMYAAGQNLVSGHSILIYDASGVPLDTLPFTSNVANGANQAKILIATPAFVTEFGITADLVIPAAVIQPAGGKICFDTIDCLTWGNYSGPGPIGTPAAPAGIPPGQSLARRLDLAGSPAVLDASDDTENSANDFVLARPAPRNNAGNGCGDGNLDPLEVCDDGNSVPMDGCTRCGNDAVGVDDEPLAGSRLRAAPNPFSADVALSLALVDAGDVEIGVYDLVGRRVRRLTVVLPAGTHRVIWDGRDDAGLETGAGFYIVRARSQGFESTTRLLRLR